MRNAILISDEQVAGCSQSHGRVATLAAILDVYFGEYNISHRSAHCTKWVAVDLHLSLVLQRLVQAVPVMLPSTVAATYRGRVYRDHAVAIRTRLYNTRNM